MPFNPDEYLAQKQEGFNPDAYLSQKSSSEDALQQALAEESWLGRQAAGMGSAAAKTYYGAKQLLQGGNLSPEDVQSVKDWTTIEQAAPVGAIAGNIATMALPAGAMTKVPMMAGAGRAILSPSSLKAAAAVGAGYAGLQPTTKQGTAGFVQRGEEAAKGALASAAGYGIAKGVGRMLAPQTSPEILALQQAGVTPTPGQIMGGGAKKAEEALRSVPILGDVITSAQKKNIEQFNRAAINRSLNPIGEKIEKSAPVGYKAVENAYLKISDKYDDLLPKLNIQADDAFNAELSSLQKLAGNMNPAQATQFQNIVKNEITDKFTEYGKMSGETMKRIESKLGDLSRNYLKATEYDQQQLGSAIKEAQSILRGMVERNNPKYAGELQKINNAYANLLVIENAAAKTGAKEGVFTPAQLESASRALDSSLRKRQFSHGKALMQDLATAGDVALAQKLPTSGTAERLMYGGGTLAGLGGGLASGLVSPLVPLGIGLGAAAYTQPAQRAIAAAMTQRPEALRQIGGRLSELAPYGALIGAGASQ